MKKIKQNVFLIKFQKYPFKKLKWFSPFRLNWYVCV